MNDEPLTATTSRYSYLTSSLKYPARASPSRSEARGGAAVGDLQLKLVDRTPKVGDLALAVDALVVDIANRDAGGVGDDLFAMCGLLRPMGLIINARGRRAPDGAFDFGIAGMA